MKTNDENQEGAFKPKKNRRWMIHVFYLAILIAIVLLWKCCSDKKEKEHEAEKLSWLQKEDSLKSKNFGLGKENDSLKWRTWKLEYSNDSLKSRIEELENRKAIPLVSEKIVNGKPEKQIFAKIVPLNDPRKSTLFIEDCLPVPECPPCPEINKGLVNLISEMDSMLNASFKIYLNKHYRTDSSKVLLDKKVQIKEFFKNPTPINYTHNYIEYLPNPYRKKAQNSFWGGVGFGALSVGLYATSEALGHPKYWDNMDNSAADKKHNTILGLRIGSAVSAAASLFEFSRTIYFHHKETKFIVNPTQIGLTISLDTKSLK